MDSAELLLKVNENKSKWGRASLTDLEVRVIMKLKSSGESWEEIEQRILDDDYMTKEVLESLELSDNEIETYFIQMAIAHGCPVAKPVYENPARSKIESLWSYITKNRAYRAILRAMVRNNREDLLAEWRGPEEKQENEEGKVTLIRPDIPLIGIEKVEVFWICQLLKNMEEILEYKHMEYGITDDQWSEIDSNAQYEEFNEILDNMLKRTSSVRVLCLRVFIETLKILKNAGLKKDIIVQVLFKGYNPEGPLKEHGQFDKVTRLWNDITKHASPIDLEIAADLKRLANEKIEEVRMMEIES
jgi:hypothetical protein